MKNLFLISISLIGINSLPLLGYGDSLAEKVSPDQKYTFGLQEDSPNNYYYLVHAGTVIWRDTGSTWSKLIAEWSPDSQHILYVAGDRFKLIFLNIRKSEVTCAAIDGTQLMEYGIKLIPYNWALINQGSIPHESILSLQSSKDWRVFHGVYERSRYPNKVNLEFTLTLKVNGDHVVPFYTFSKPRYSKW